MKTDILIVGAGCAGLYCALHLPKEKQVLIITKDAVRHSDSFLAQGGICMLKDDSDYESYFEDTMRAGHYENNPESVEIMIRSSQTVVKELIRLGISFHEDITGKEITSKLLERVKARPNVQILEYAAMLDLLSEDNCCYGAVVRLPDGTVTTVLAETTVLACGGIGGLYRYTTNYRHLTGDGIAVAFKHGVALEHINYVQIHPTTLYCDKPQERSFLISESVRGEGAVLYNKNMERFVDELLPRDILTKKIYEQMEKDQTPYVWLSMEHIPQEELTVHFPNIVKHCREKGYDVFRECIPVVPAQHYFMGGIRIDLFGRTSMGQLYAVGETACNGVHGRNRLASNSLLESLVFAGRAAEEITRQKAGAPVKCQRHMFSAESLLPYQDEKALAAGYKKTILNEIERLNNYV